MLLLRVFKNVNTPQASRIIDVVRRSVELIIAFCGSYLSEMITDHESLNTHAHS